MSKKLVFPDKKFFWKVLKLMIPLMLGQMIIVSVSFIDNVMVGHYGNADLNLASVAVANEIWYFIFNVMISISVVSSIFMAQYYGARKNDEFKDLTRNAIVLSLIFISFVSIFVLAKPEWFLHIFTQDQEIIDHSKTFLRLISAGTFLSAISYPLQTSLNVIGKMKYVVISAAVALVTNAVFDYVFIYPLDMGIMGAGVATLISRVFEFALVMWFSYRNSDRVFAGFNWFKFNVPLFKQLMGKWTLIASSVLYVGSLSGLSAIFTNSHEEVMAAMGTGYAVSGLMWTIFPAIAAATKVMIGKRLGRDDFQLAKDNSRKLNTSIMMIAVVLSAAVAGIGFFLPQIVGLEGMEKLIARDMILIFAGANIFYVLGSVLFSALEAGGITKPSVIFNNVFQVVVVIPLVAGLAFGTNWAFWEVFLVSQMIQVIPTIFAYYYYHQFKWVNNLTDELDEEIVEEKVDAVA